ncbi:glycosyltransferase family 4 protein [Brachybacterium phenoliresistens]|uniref:glycosyltransferase family 4 protein n=1 Tax=Brachybacterium phenoliresistens TaxID=396014 RepID=UPI0031D9E485
MNLHRETGDAACPRVMIVANYTADSRTSNNRFNDLASRLAARGARVELVTSRFSHFQKAARTDDLGETGYAITRLDEPGYSRNISPARLRSQARFGREVARYLDSLDAPPDLIVAAAPPPGVAAACVRYAGRAGVPCALDIQDLWPEAFGMVMDHPHLIDIVFHGMRRDSRVAYRTADLVFGVSCTYTDSAVRHGADPAATRVVYLGTDLTAFDVHAGSSEPPAFAASGRPVVGPVIGYAGGLSDSYDIPVVIDALAILARADTLPEIPTLVVMGDGARRSGFEEHARDRGVDVRFTGNLAYPEMVRTLAACEIAVNPIVAGSAGSVLNKAGDYAAAGLPVVNSQESAEYRGLLERYRAGISGDAGDPRQMAAAIRRLVMDPELRRSMARGSRRMGEELFDRSVTYESMIDELVGLIGRAPGRHAAGRAAG